MIGNFDVNKIYTRNELKLLLPDGYYLVERNYKKNQGAVSYDKYKVIEVIEDIGIYEGLLTSFSNVRCYEGIVIVEMVYPEKDV